MFSSRQLVMSREWSGVLREHGLDKVEGVFSCGKGVVVRQSGSTEVRLLELMADGKPKTFFLKKNWLSKPSQLRARFFRGTFFGKSKVEREFENLGRLRELGLNAAKPVAWGEERRLGWLVRAFLLTEGIENPQPLDLCIRDSLPQMSKAEASNARNELIQNLAELTRKLHEHRFVHRDLFWRNVVISGGLLAKLFLIDVPRGHRWRGENDLHHRARDLAALDAPAPKFFRRTERLRFFLHYAGRSSLTSRDKELIRLVLKLAAPMRKRQLKHVRAA